MTRQEFAARLLFWLFPWPISRILPRSLRIYYHGPDARPPLPPIPLPLHDPNLAPLPDWVPIYFTTDPPPDPDAYQQYWDNVIWDPSPDPEIVVPYLIELLPPPEPEPPEPEPEPPPPEPEPVPPEPEPVPPEPEPVPPTPPPEPEPEPPEPEPEPPPPEPEPIPPEPEPVPPEPEPVPPTPPPPVPPPDPPTPPWPWPPPPPPTPPTPKRWRPHFDNTCWETKGAGVTQKLNDNWWSCIDIGYKFLTWDGYEWVHEEGSMSTLYYTGYDDSGSQYDVAWKYYYPNRIKITCDTDNLISVHCNSIRIVSNQPPGTFDFDNSGGLYFRIAFGDPAGLPDPPYHVTQIQFTVPNDWDGDKWVTRTDLTFMRLWAIGEWNTYIKPLKMKITFTGAASIELYVGHFDSTHSTFTQIAFKADLESDEELELSYDDVDHLNHLRIITEVEITNIQFYY